MFKPMIPQRLTRSVLLSVLTLILLWLSGCKAPQSFGDRHSIIVLADPALWAEVQSAVLETLEQRVFTTRPERKFRVTHVAPDDPEWASLRMWQQVVVIGTAEDELVRQIVNPNVAAPALVQTTDVWARTQTVTVLLLPAAAQPDAVRGLLPQLYGTLDTQYTDWVIERMYTSGVNDSLAAALEDHGFTLQLPQVYIHTALDSVFRFGNPYRQGDTDLLRSVLVTWMNGARSVTAEELRAWRQAAAGTEYDPPQDVLDEGFRGSTIDVDGRAGMEVRGVWQDRAEFPAAGPFIARAIACPEQDRTYYIDAWLYAPGTDKYPYVRQLEIILDSFRCIGN
jgi:hypothetical protein